MIYPTPPGYDWAYEVISLMRCYNPMVTTNGFVTGYIIFQVLLIHFYDTLVARADLDRLAAIRSDSDAAGDQ